MKMDRSSLAGWLHFKTSTIIGGSLGHYCGVVVVKSRCESMHELLWYPGDFYSMMLWFGAQDHGEQCFNK
ncbi:hypothetical protein XELAEV_18044781mg [Xenopus laevis]|uniref:Uncharacterized protein n=1 Tax=Xenopus laevis TaxID=8355 RepID=A0A974BZP5_XENLA|nr:hypothetical protein XELAEV_18044781mg [Xenopus laevis]